MPDLERCSDDEPPNHAKDHALVWCLGNPHHPTFCTVRDYAPHWMGTLLAIQSLPEREDESHAS